MALPRNFLTILILFVSHVACAQVVGIVETELPPSKINEEGSSYVTIARLMIADESGIPMPANERYLVFYNDNYPVIVDKINGHTPSILIQDYDLDGENEIGLYYFSGGNQYNLRLYEYKNGNVIPFKTQINSSNMRKIEFDDNYIFVYNNSFSENGRSVTSESWKVIDGDCVFAKEPRANQ